MQPQLFRITNIEEFMASILSHLRRWTRHSRNAEQALVLYWVKLTHLQCNQGLRCLLRQNRSLNKDTCTIIFLIMSCDSSIYTIDHLDLIVCNFMEKSIVMKMFNAENVLNAFRVSKVLFL